MSTSVSRKGLDVRIVAGKFKGRAVKSPSADTTRPTTDRVRESVFSSVLSRTNDLSLEGMTVLDAFAGSGALGFEALSRGAVRCTFWEQDSQARSVLESNAASLGLTSREYCCKSGDVLQSASRPLSFGAPFGLVLLDPPYAFDPAGVAGFVSQLKANGDIAAGSIVVYEHVAANMAAAQEAFAGLGGFEITGHKKYGKVAVMYLEVL